MLLHIAEFLSFLKLNNILFKSINHIFYGFLGCFQSWNQLLRILSATVNMRMLD